MAKNIEEFGPALTCNTSADKHTQMLQNGKL